MNLKSVTTAFLLLGSSLSQRRVIGGEVAKPFNFPFLVSIQENGGHTCGGSLLNQDTILTAAHCKGDTPLANVTVHVHRHNLTREVAQEKGFQSKIKSFVIHPKFNVTGNTENDVAIIKLTTPIPKEIEVKYVKINEDKANESVGKTYTLAGWGRYLAESDDTSPLLLQGDLKVTDLDKCVEAYEGFITKGSICGLPVKKKAMDCQGDSGGPVFTKNQDGSVLQIALVSYGRADCDPKSGEPSVYANLRELLPWIKENLGGNTSKRAKVKGWVAKLASKTKHVFGH